MRVKTTATETIPESADEVEKQEVRIPDYLTGALVKETPKEKVRQDVARRLVKLYAFDPACMARDFKVKVDGKQKKIDIAIFTPGKEHTVENLIRAVVCRPEPKLGKRQVIKMRDYDQAHEDLAELEDILHSAKLCEWGLWTNGLEEFFLHKDTSRRFDQPIDWRSDWPLADGSLSTPDHIADLGFLQADEQSLKAAFRRCHNFIHGNEGMPKDAAFWQFLYLIFAKMYDERHNPGNRQFYAFPDEPFKPEGQSKIRSRIDALFTRVKKEPPYSSLFKANDAITLSPRALAYMVAEMQRFDFRRTGVDVKGAAYQEIVGNNLRGDRGQYFTPRSVVNLAIRILDPQPDEKLLDPACGTGGFIVASIDHQFRRFKRDYDREPGDRTLDSIHSRLRDYAQNYVFGADFDPFLVRASTMNVLMSAGVEGNIFHMDSLAFPKGHLTGNALAQDKISLGSIDVLVTNPPFGSDIPITERFILESNPLAKRMIKSKEGERSFSFTETQNAVAPEILFISQAIKWLKEGGRCALVLPNGVLGNPGDEPIRKWILEHCWVLGCVEVPVEAFIVEANVGILTSVLFLKKKTEKERAIAAMRGGEEPEYPIFMAVAERCGVDRRGNPLYKRHPDGSEIIKEHEIEEIIFVGGRKVARKRILRGPVVDDDFPVITEAYRKFRQENPEPGSRPS
ncbi:restriction endonuclease subunit M [Opitutaceae bacterium TAV4]|nr:restriction endonuclease subunit M [Opitutaceae bacterium TAV4]RRK02168.1 restriction endonuclease subunit M [Opitutaceae bacterium TAV3]